MGCSSSQDDTAPSTSQFDGTYVATSETGSSPFLAISFLDGSRYSYLSRSCADATPDPPYTGEALAADDCEHEGTYSYANGVLSLTDDGSDSTRSIPFTFAGAAGSLTPQDLVSADAGALVTSPSTVNAAGTTLARSGDGSGNGDAGPLVQNQAVASAMQWVNVQMPYCWAIKDGWEGDKDCIPLHGKKCSRTDAQSSSTWDPYRSDCSGLVSYAWGLPPPGLLAYVKSFYTVANPIPTQDLQPGDALVTNGHIVLFESWTDQKSGKAKVIAEPGCKAPNAGHADEEDWSVIGSKGPGKASAQSWDQGKLGAKTYWAIRKK